MTTTQGTEPTQVRRPWRAVVRTALAVGIPAILLLPTIVQAIIEELGPQLPPGFTEWLVAAGAFVTAFAALITRLMALPQVELVFRRLPGAAFAAQPQPKPEDRDEAGSIQLIGTMAGPWGATASLPVRGASRDRTLPGKQRIRSRRAGI